MQEGSVVVLSDDESVLLEIQNKLNYEGFCVDSFKKVPLFFDYLNKNTPILIIIDFDLKSLDYVETIKRIKNDHRLSFAPIAVFSKNNEELNIIEALDLGADIYMVKPFSSKELVARCKAVLRSL